MGEATERASVDRVSAGMVVATAVRMPLFPLSTPITALDSLETSSNKCRTGCIVPAPLVE